MTKILKVKIQRNRVPGQGTTYKYPPEYRPELIKVTCYESIGNRAEVLERDKEENPYEYCIGVVDDDDLAQFIASPDIEEITKGQAIALGTQWRPQAERVVDQLPVLEVLRKVRTGQPLTQEDKDIIDPDKPNRGVHKSRSYQVVLDKNISDMDKKHGRHKH